MPFARKISVTLAATTAMLFAVPARADHHADAVSPPVTEARTEVTATPALWKIADEDTTIYWFGTVHILPEGIDWLDGPVEQALGEAGTLVTEIVEPAPAEMQATILAAARRDDGQTLRATLSPELATAYADAMGSVGIPTAAFDQFDTWYAALTLGVIPILKSGYSPEHGVDNRIIAIASERGIDHAGLETAAYQYSLFDSLSQEEQTTYLAQVIEAMPEVKEQLDAMIAAWSAGDADALAAIMNEDMDSPKLREVLLTTRNRAWADWAKKRLETPGVVFVAVGAGHLAGKMSVQDMLAVDGIESVRIQ